MTKYTQTTKDLTENGSKRQALFPQIESVMVEFTKEKSASVESTERAKVRLSLLL